MTDIQSISKEVAKRTKLDRELVETICKFPFLFAVDVMKDEEDTHDILFNRLFKFKLKTRFKNNKSLQYSPRL